MGSLQATHEPVAEEGRKGTLQSGRAELPLAPATGQVALGKDLLGY